MGSEFLAASADLQGMRKNPSATRSFTHGRTEPADPERTPLRLLEGGARSALATARREFPLDRAPLQLVSARDIPTVLIGDGDEEVLSLLSFMLAGEFELLRARNGEQALRLALIERPDLVVLDVHMPKLDGYRVTCQIRRNPATCDTPVILLDDDPERIDVLRGFAAGANDYISKPFDAVTLLDRIRETLEITEIVS
jgi:CheY-like chemotaxis protein